MAALQRCAWVGDDPAMIAYHDDEWGVPSRDDRHLYEMLVLEGAQAGLSWSTILRKRAGYRAAFADFDPAAVARYTDADVDRLVADPGIVRHRGKIEWAITNARAVLAVQAEHGSFARYLWAFVADTPVVLRHRRLEDVPAETDQSRAMSKDMRKRGFGFCGPTICYALMQAVGMADDHMANCFRAASAASGSSGRRRPTGAPPLRR